MGHVLLLRARAVDRPAPRGEVFLLIIALESTLTVVGVAGFSLQSLFLVLHLLWVTRGDWVLLNFQSHLQCPHPLRSVT